VHASGVNTQMTLTPNNNSDDEADAEGQEAGLDGSNSEPINVNNDNNDSSSNDTSAFKDQSPPTAVDNHSSSDERDSSSSVGDDRPADLSAVEELPSVPVDVDEPEAEGPEDEVVGAPNAVSMVKIAVDAAALKDGDLDEPDAAAEEPSRTDLIRTKVRGARTVLSAGVANGGCVLRSGASCARSRYSARLAHD
jgi:hypothetical protein